MTDTLIYWLGIGVMVIGAIIASIIADRLTSPERKPETRQS